MKRLIHFGIPVSILLFTAAVLAKLIGTPVMTGQDTYAWKISPYQAVTFWERGWPWVFEQYHVQDPPTVGGVLAPADIYPRESSGWALAGDLAVAVGVIAVVGLWIFYRVRKSRPWSFSIRTMLAATMLVAACCGWWSHERWLWQRERAAIAELNAADCRPTSYDETPSWLRRLFADHVTLPINAMDFAGPSNAKWPERELIIFTRVREIYFPAMPEPREKFLRVTNSFPSFRSLQQVCFTSTASHLDSELLAPLANCESVIEVRPWYSDIDNDGIAVISKMRSIVDLNLNSCPNVTDEAIDSLLKLPSLKRLWLKGTSLSDAGVRRLLALPNLKIACLPDGVSPETVELFQRQGIAQDWPGFTSAQ